MYVKPYWNNWLKKDIWSLDEAILLSMNIEPDEDNELPDKYYEIEELALRSWKVRRLNTVDDSRLIASWKMVTKYRDPCKGMSQLDTLRSRQAGMVPRPYKEAEKQEQQPNLSPSTYILWAIEKDINIPDEMRDFVKLSENDAPQGLSEADGKRLYAAYLKSLGKSYGDIAKEIFPDHGSETKNKKSMANQLAREGTERYLAGKAAKTCK